MKKFLLLFAVLIALLQPGCGGGGSDSSGNTGQAAFTVHWPTRSRIIPIASESIKFVISNPEGQPVASNLLQRPSGGGDVTVTIAPLPVGDLPVTATAYPNADGTGTPQGTASVILHSVAGQVQSVTLTLNSTITSIDITAATLNVPVGGSQQLVQTPRDQGGSVVFTLPSTISWQSSNTAVATVSGTGLVTGVSAGNADITVTETESGKSKTVGVTIGSSTGATGTIAFLGVVTGKPGTYTVHGDGSALTYISPFPDGSGRDVEPVVAPNRQLVAVGYHQGAALYDDLIVQNANGGNGAPTWSARAYSRWSWSPDSTRIAYNGAQIGGGSDGLHIINANGTGDTKIDPQGMHPEWSPDGTRIVAADFTTGTLFFIRPDGTNRQTFGIGEQARWFPNSQRLAFLRAGLLYIAADSGTGEVLVFNGNIGTYSVSPDGTKIAFSGTAPGTSVIKVYVYTVGTGATLEIANGFSPAWSPDGSLLAYGFTDGIHFVNPDGTGDHILPGVTSATLLHWR